MDDAVDMAPCLLMVSQPRAQLFFHVARWPGGPFLNVPGLFYFGFRPNADPERDGVFGSALPRLQRIIAMATIPRNLAPRPKPPAPAPRPTYTLEQMRSFGWIHDFPLKAGLTTPRIPDPRIPNGPDPRLNKETQK